MKVTLKDGLFICRDRNGALWAYEEEPTIGEDSWYYSSGNIYCIVEGILNIPDLGSWEESLHIVRDGELVKYIKRPNIAVDTPLWVRDYKGGFWWERHFAKWCSHGLYCWEDGKTSHTTGTYAHWNEYSLTDQNKGESK